MRRLFADRLVITLRAAEKYVSSIFTKLGLPSGGSDSRRVLAVLMTAEIGTLFPPCCKVSKTTPIREPAPSFVFCCTSVTCPISLDPFSTTVWPFCLTALVAFKTT